VALKIGISYPQMSRYEVKNVQPPADIHKRLADVLNTTVDYLVNGDVDENAKASLNNAKLLSLFKSVERMDDNDKTVITRLISAFIIEREMQSRLIQNA
jgi:transcriptional regulator with XRE-family HTH domain